MGLILKEIEIDRIEVYLDMSSQTKIIKNHTSNKGDMGETIKT